MRQLTELETNAVSIERIKEYTEVDTEKEWTIEETAPPADWPTNGTIDFSNYRTRYREGLDFILDDLSVAVKAQEKVGVCGRTGECLQYTEYL